MKRNFTYLQGALACAAIFLAASCGEPQFKVKGEIQGADNVAVVLEKSDFHGRWVLVDSTRTNSKGAFSISRPAPAAPDIFRLEVNGNFVYFPVDSIETISVASTLDGFGKDYSLEGSENAELMEAFDKEVLALPAGISPDSLASFKKNVFSKYIRNSQGSIVSYYVLTKTLGNDALFNPDDDYKYFAAVATGFKQTRPNDPRAALLERTALESIRKRNQAQGKRLEIAAEEITMIDVDLPDEKGVNRKLSSLTGKGKPVVLMFTVLSHPDSPAVNAALSQLYNSRGGSVEFYQVGLDPDQYAWRDAASNLPWTTVFDATGEYSSAARKYNVSSLPVFFIYGADGSLKARANSVDELRKQI